MCSVYCLTDDDKDLFMVKSGEKILIALVIPYSD
jgi:hypothetical protein